MRITLLIIASISFLSPKAQTLMPAAGMNFTQWLPLPGYNQFNDVSHLNQKWQFGKYIGISASYGFFTGSSPAILSAPIGLQLTRQLNNNLYAFTGISAGPAFSFSRSFTGAVLNQPYPGSTLSSGYGFGINSRVDMGLMYINDAKTFSISGSIGVERSSYPVYPSNRMDTKKR